MSYRELLPLHPDSHGAESHGPVVLKMPPDKSLLHRILIIGALSRASITIPNAGIQHVAQDTLATVLALEALGVPIDASEDGIELQGVGTSGLRAPNHTIHCANSGTTARLLTGLCAGLPVTVRMEGDASLSRRPMRRLTELLVTALGAEISTSEQGTLPMLISGRSLRAGAVALPVASAQMKSAVLLAGVASGIEVSVTEPTQSRDHTERMLNAFGYELSVHGLTSTLQTASPKSTEQEIRYLVPGDISSAAFLIVAAVLTHHDVCIERALLNPTRSKFLDVLYRAGVAIEMRNTETYFGEPIGDVWVYGSRTTELNPLTISADDVASLIDEIPILAVVALFANGVSSIRGAGELRHKESDRIAVLARELRALTTSATVEEFPDGLRIYGERDRTLRRSTVDHSGDHRIAMALAVAALRAEAPIRLDDPEIVSISYPQFYEHLAQVSGS